MPATVQSPPAADLEDRVARLEARFAQLEAQLAAARTPAAPLMVPAPVPGATTVAAAEPRVAVPTPPAAAAHDLELELGRNWFARAGILALAAAGAFMLTLPYAGLPPAVPSAVGAALALILFGLARILERPYAVLSTCLRAAAMALLFCAAVRLFLFGAVPAFPTDSHVGRALLLGAVAVNLAIGLRRRSPWLSGLALAAGYASVLVIRSGYFGLGVLLALAVAALAARRRVGSDALVVGAAALTYLTYVAAAILQGGSGAGARFATEPAIAPAVLLVCWLLFATAPLRPAASDDAETPLETLHALVNGALGYGAFLVHTLASFGAMFAAAQVAAAVVFLGTGALLRVKRRAAIATFVYAMTGYLAVSMALLKWSAPPNVFVWLSLESMLVVATAIAFRSRFIVVANFAIYVGMVAAYMLLQERETGISIGFGVVALASARMLNWQKHRLELKTELMRNAYLLSAFVVFPYALSHLVPARFVALAWVMLAVGYYVLGLVVRNRKYRWLGHGTLVLAAGYALLADARQVGPLDRVLALLALGAVLVVVSVAFTRRGHDGRPPERPA